VLWDTDRALSKWLWGPWIFYKEVAEIAAELRGIGVGQAQALLREACAKGHIRCQLRSCPTRTTVYPHEWNEPGRITPDGRLNDPSTKQPGLSWPFPIELEREDVGYWLKENTPQAKLEELGEPQPEPEAQPGPATPQPEAQPESPPAKDAGGRPEEHDWEEAGLYALELLKEKGDPADRKNRVKGWNSKSDLARAVQAHLNSDPDKQPDLSLVRRRVSGWRAEFHRLNST
jgi:hypothetical protein